MRAALITGYQRPLELVTMADPELPKDGIIMKVRATGVCRSDWHTWTSFPELVLPSSHRSSFADQHHPANRPATPSGRGNGR